MPIYEYACKSCKHTLDALQKMSDPPLVECPECGQPALRRLISAPRFRLKGEGWYETDFKKDNQRNLVSKDSESRTSANGDGKSDGKSDKPKSDGDGKESVKAAKTAEKAVPSAKNDSKADAS